MESLTFLQFIGEFSLAAFTGVMLSAIKYINSGFVWALFWEDSLKPFIYSFLGGIIIIATTYFAPQFTFFIEQTTGEEVSLNHERLLLVGGALSAVLKSLFKNPKVKRTMGKFA